MKIPFPRRLNTIFGQTFAGFVAAMLISGALVFALTWWLMYPRHTVLHYYPDEDRATLVREVATLGGRDALIKWLSSQESGPHRILMYAVDRDGHDIAGHAIPEETLREARTLYAEHPERLGLHEITLEGQKLLLFNARPPVDYFQETTRAFFFPRHGVPFWLTCLISLVAACGVALALTWRLTRPVRKLENGMIRVAGGDLSVRTADSLDGCSEELVELARRFDLATATIQQLLDRQQKLFHSVSHEIRSPLARINCEVDLARRAPESVPKMLDRIELDVRKLDELVGDLLTYTRLDADVSIPMTEIDLSEIVWDIADTASVEAESKNLKIECRLPEEELLMRGNGDLIAHALENVLRNAMRYSPEGGKIVVGAEAFPPGQLTLSVEDEGPGVAEKEAEQIFEPLVRGSDQSTGTGYGLGLAIARRAAQHHGGTIRAENVRPHGLRVVFTFPREEAREAEAPRGGEPRPQCRPRISP